MTIQKFNLQLFAHTKQERYSALVDAKLRAGLVTLDGGSVPVFNTRYEGNPKAGAVKIPVRDAEVDMGTYNPTTGKTLTEGTTTYLTVTDFYDEAVNELIDGYAADAVPDDLVADRLESAGYSGGLRLDSDGIATLEAEGTTDANTTGLTADTVYDAFVDAGTALTQANVPLTGRYAIVSPVVHGLLLKSPDFIKQSDLGQQLVQQGYVGQIAGFNVKVSNNVDPLTEFITGHADWCHRIREWVVEPFIQDLNGDSDFVGASAVKGRWVFKHKVSKAAAVLVKTKLS